MVNGNFDKNCSKSDEENVHHRNDTKCGSPSSSDSTAAAPSPKTSNSVASCKNDMQAADVGDEEVSSRDMAKVSAKTSLFCSVPLSKFRCVLSSASGKNDDEENSSKIKQFSRKLLCLYCDRTFVSSSLRQKHVERCHSEKQSRRLSSRKLQSQFTTTACFHCDKLPAEHSLRQLFEHLISTHSQKYFGCLLCEERFLNQMQLNDHNTKLHNFSHKEQQTVHLPKVVKGSENSTEANNASTSSIEEKTDTDQKTNKNSVKKKKTTKSKSPPRQLRSKKKVAIKATKVGSKRSQRLQSAQNKVPERKKKTRTESTKSEENTSKNKEKAKTSSINPYPEFDNYYRVKKITDHSIDNLKISSLTFDDVFDKAFFNRIKCNIQENLMFHLDGKLFKNEESESRISNFEKNPPTQEVSNTASENYGCDLSLNAVTPVTSILTPNFGEDLESQIEYGSKPSKKKLQIRQDPVRHKYVTRRKYQASILEHKENRDLSKLDMWTQLVIKDRQQKVLNGQKSAKEILEYTTCAEYKLKIQRNELNRILDRRGPFEDLKEEASKKAALEHLNSESYNEISEECFKEVRFLMEDLLTEVVKNCSKDEVQFVCNVDEKPEFPEKEDIPELPDYLQLRRTSSVPSEEEIDKSDKIALICSSQETENYELPTNTVRNKDEMIELSGEWARSRIYVCAACGLKVSNMKLLIDHKSMYHQNSWVQHYELVGNQSELYRHLCIPGLGKVGHVEETVPCKSWVKSESRVCTKCGKVCNSLSELHRHILECGGDWTWMLARKKCKYRPFGARKKRRGLVKRIRVSNQKTDQTEKKKYKKSFEGPRQRPSDADTIQRMLANLPPKRSSRKSICMKDGFSRNRQKSPINQKQVMKCGKIVRHKSTYDGNAETSKNTNNHKTASVRQTLRSISRTLSSKILDTNSKLKAKRQLIQKINRRSPRKNSQNICEANNMNVKNEESSQIESKKTEKIGKNRNGQSDKVKSILKEKVNIKNFFPVSKRKASRKRFTENSNSDSSQLEQNVGQKNNSEITQNKTSSNVIKSIKNSLILNKKGKVIAKNYMNTGGKSEPIVMIEKLPPPESTDNQPTSKPTTKKAPNKRKLRSSFRKVIDKVKKLKLDHGTSLLPSKENKETSMKPGNSFLGQGAREKEKLAIVLVPLVEESKESPPSNLAFVQNAMDNNSPTEESLIPENIFNLQHNSEDLLQAKSPLETLTNDVQRNEKIECLSSMSAKVSNIFKCTKEHESFAEIETESDLTKPIKYSIKDAKINQKYDTSQGEKMSSLSIDTATKSDKNSLVSPVLSPSMLSPKMKGKIRKPNRGLNDCIAMLTKKAFEETHKTVGLPNSSKSIEKKTCLDNTNEAHKIIRANECILKIPIIEGNSQLQSEVLDLSKPKQNLETINPPRKNTIDPSTPKPAQFWNPVNDICNSQALINDSKTIWPSSSNKLQNTIGNPNFEKAILKIPKFVEASRSNNVDNTIQGVIQNYDEPVTKSESIMSHLKVPSVDLLNSVDKIIEEVVKGNFTISASTETSLQNTKPSVAEKSLPKKENNILTQQKSSKPKKIKRINKSKEENISSLKDTISDHLTSLTHDKVEASSSQECMVGELLLKTQDKIESTSEECLVAEILPRSTDVNNVSPSPERISSEKSLNNTESISHDTIHENNIPFSEEVGLDISRYSFPKRTEEKIGAARKKTEKLSIKSKDKMKAENTHVEQTDIKVITHNIPNFQTNESNIIEDKQIPMKQCEKIVDCMDLSLDLPIESQEVNMQYSSCTDSSQPSEEDSKLVQNREEISTNETSFQKNIELPEERHKSEVILNEANLKYNTTYSSDSEDELPLLILKTRNNKDLLNKIPAKLVEVTEELPGNKIEVNEFGPSTIEKENTESNMDKKIEVQEIIENKSQLNKLINGEFPFPTENEKLSEANAGFSEEDSESILQNPGKIIKLTKNTSSLNEFKRVKNAKKSKKGIKSKHSSNIKAIKNSEESTGEEKLLENISNIIETKDQIGDVCADTSNTEISNVFKGKKTYQNHLDKYNIDPNKKTKNFLVDTTDLKKDMEKSPMFSSKSNKTKKKDKSKHDSMKAKLIFKFPKIILKEPVLRIPPRNITPESTSFGSKTDNSEEKGVKLILDNPFANIKKHEEKISPISNISEQSTEIDTPSKSKLSSRKRSNKHKKKSLKVLGKEENSDLLVGSNKISSSSSPIHEDAVAVQENFGSLSDDSNILSVAQLSSNIPHVDTSELLQKNYPTEKSVEVNGQQPITLKLQTQSTKRSVSRKKRNKIKKTGLFPHANEESSQVDISGSEEANLFGNENVNPETDEIKELTVAQKVEKIGNSVEDSPSLKSEENKLEIQTNEIINKSADGSKVPNETLVLKSQMDSEEKQPSCMEILDISLIDNLQVESKECILPKSGRSLRSTVKITYKQSNIFELQIEDKEISDLKISDKSKNLQPNNDLCENTSLLQEKSLIQDNEMSNIDNGDSKTRKIVESGSFEEFAEIVFAKNGSNSKKTKTNCHEILSQKNFGQPICHLIKNEKKSNKTDANQLSEDQSKLNLMGIEEIEQKIQKPPLTSKKNRRVSKVKKTSNQLIQENSIEALNSFETKGISEVEEASGIPEKKILQNEILEKIRGNSGNINSSNDHIVLEKTNEAFSLQEESTVSSEQKSIGELLYAEKYEDSSFSEGELVINESFENRESAIHNEIIEGEESATIVSSVIQNMLKEHDDVPIIGDSKNNIVAQKKTQKSRRRKKAKSSRSQKKSNSGNHNLGTIVSTNLNVTSFIENNQNAKLKENEKLSPDMNIAKQCVVKPVVMIDNICDDPLLAKLGHKKNDEFEFDEDNLPLQKLSSDFEKNNELRCQVDQSNNLEVVESLIPQTKVELRTSSVDSSATANLRSTESEFDIDQILNIKYSTKTGCHAEYPYDEVTNEMKLEKNEETKRENKITEISFTTIEVGEKFKINSSSRKSRAAKAKAIENIKILETKVNDIEGAETKNKKVYLGEIGGNDVSKKISRSKDRNSTHLKGHNAHDFGTRCGEAHSLGEVTGEEESTIDANKITSVPFEFSTSNQTKSSMATELCKSTEKKEMDVMNYLLENSEVQQELYNKFNRKEKHSKNQPSFQDNVMKKQEDKNSTPKKSEKEDIFQLEKNKSSKCKISKLIREVKEKNTEENDNLEKNCKIGALKSTADNDSVSLINLFSTNSDILQKQMQNGSSLGDFRDKKKKNKTDCYDIANIDDDNNLGSIESILLSPSKKKKKSIRNEEHDEIKEHCPRTLAEEAYTMKRRFVKALDDVSLENDINETEQVDSLDVTLKTTVDEISSILMENKDSHEISNPFSNTNFKESCFHPTMSNESRKNCTDKYCWNEEQKSTNKQFQENSWKSNKKKRNRDRSCGDPTITKDKSWNMEIQETFETEIKRRSKRACKVNTYNENDLAEAIFDQAATEKEKGKTKKIEESISGSSITSKKNVSNKVSTEKKLNSEELFDLLKATAPDNLIALKPVEENPSDILITDDNFDDEFDDILRKSQALFGEKKLDDICRSDDSSSTYKSTAFGRLDDTNESNVLLEKSTKSYLDETAFNTSIISSSSRNQINKSEELSTLPIDDLYCDICKKSFKRLDNLIKHRTTLTHIAKLSEIEAKEAQNKLRVDTQSTEDSSCSNKLINQSYSFPNENRNDALAIAEIITEALEKPAPHAERGFSELITPLPEYRRYKSLGERKSFEYDQGSPNIAENSDLNNYKPKLSNNTGVILEKQITLLQNIVGLDCINEASTSSYQSLGISVGRDSPVSIISSKLEDSTNLVFSNDANGGTGRSKVEDFRKPPQIEDISQDSVNLKNAEDVKSRKVLNRDEELFLECCSLLKSGSEVSNFSKKSNKNSFFTNVSSKMTEEPDMLESKNIIYKATEDSSDLSRRATPLGDSFGDTSNSNTICSSWGVNNKEPLKQNQENFFNFSQEQKYFNGDEGSFNSSNNKNAASMDAAKSSPNENGKLSLDAKTNMKEMRTPNESSSKTPTKGSLKKFAGLKVSLPTSKLKMDILRKKLSEKKLSINITEKPSSEKQFVSPLSPRRKSKPVKNKTQIDDRFIFKVNKKATSKVTEETKSKSSKETANNKITDVYDFEETQDNTDVFAKPDFKSFRAKGTEIEKGEITNEHNDEVQTISSSSSSTLSGKKAKTNECITKKKHMIMGRIFKNAVKPKLDEEIKDIPTIDHNELVEKFVKSCTPKQEEEQFKKPKMTAEEMNYLFDKLLDKPTDLPKKSCSSNRMDNKNTGMKKKLKMKCKKRQRSNSESTDDEFGLNQIVKKRPGRKNAKEQDNSINLEQELKECIGVASRKSQRKCTSGKQNVLVEYWSSDESAFETFLENHLQELSEKSEMPTPSNDVDKQKENDKNEISKENPVKNSCGKSKKPKSKSKVSSKKKESKESAPTIETLPASVPSNRRKRTAAHPLYHWSSSSEDELQDFIEVKSLRDDPEDDYDEERPVQHGWIVGDSPKKLVTMLAQAKGKKTEPESLVKEQGKKKNSNS